MTYKEVILSMRYSVDPQQNLLFDPSQTQFSPMALRYMNADWPGLFRSQLWVAYGFEDDPIWSWVSFFVVLVGIYHGLLLR